MQTTSLGWRTDLMVRRLAGSVVEERDGWQVVPTPANPGFWWGNFLLLPGPLQPGSGAAWAARFAADLPGARHRAYGVDGTAGAAGDDAELAVLGVDVDVSSVLTAAVPWQLPEPAARLAGAATARTLAGDDDWEQALALRRACYPGPDTAGHREFDRLRLAEARALCERGDGAWFGAFAATTLVASLGIVGDGDGLARFQDVETRPDHRRRGMARLLLTTAATWATTAPAANTLVIVADPDYHAVELYRSMGFVEAERQVQLAAATP